MGRTFTLRRLFLNLTVLCVAIGFMVSFPAFSVQGALLATLAVPTLAACVVLAHLSARPVTTVAAALFGALVVAGFGPSRTICSPLSWWDLYVINLESIAMPAAAGAMMLGALMLVREHTPRWRWPWRSRRRYPERLAFDKSDVRVSLQAAPRNATP